MEEIFSCPHCLEHFMTAQGLLIHVKYLHPALLACLVNSSVGATCVAHRHLD